jgi:tetratricopeptide (TPR) repeat protein
MLAGSSEYWQVTMPPSPPLAQTAAPEQTGTLDTALRHTTRLLEANPRLAVEQSLEILKAVPDHPTATLLLGVGYRLAGDAAAALRVLGALTRGLPRWAPAFFEFGMTLLETGDTEAALAALRRAVYLQPTLPDAWRTIGDMLTAQGDKQGADKAYAQHLKAATLDPRLMAAAQALVEGQIAQAELRLREHLKEFPTDVAAIRMLAEVAGRLGRYGDAEKLLTRAVELSPSFHPARHNLALILHRQNKFSEALEQIDLLTAAEPRNSSHRNLKALVLSRIGDFPQSLQIYADVLSKHPGQAKIWLSYAHALASVGRQQEGIDAYRRCIALDPRDGAAYWSLANLKTFRFTEAELAGMRAVLSSPGLGVDDTANLHFAIGKALEDAARYENSFTHYRLGNELRLAKVGYDPAETTGLVDRSIALFTREFMGARAGLGAAAPDPIFIVGLPRAGSTLVEQILSSHSQIEGTMELPNMMAIATKLSGTKNRSERSAYPNVLAGMSAEDYAGLGERYLAETRIQRKTGRPFFIDKMPNNFLHVGLIFLTLPNAKIIDARRHPMSCCFSGYKQNFAMGQRFTYSLTHLAKYYTDYVRLMAHFDRVIPGKVHRVIYERMVEDTETEVRSLLDYCQLPFEEACLRFYESDRAVRTASSQQVRQPINRQGMDQWRHFEAWLNPLKEALGETLSRYPYTPEY